MPSPVLEALKTLLAEDLDGIAADADHLRAPIETRFGDVVVKIDHDEDEREPDSIAIRASVSFPPPVGAGAEFLIWCLATNTQYWGVKIGLEDDGRLCVHADIEADAVSALVAADIADRVESIVQLLDEDLVEFCLGNGFGTPTQRVRWDARAPGAPDGGEDR